jgi:hypothetical protein
MPDVPKWNAKGDWFDTCKCGIPCPSYFAQPPTYGPLNLQLPMIWRTGGPRFPEKCRPAPKLLAVRQVCRGSACKCPARLVRQLVQAPSLRRERRQPIVPRPSVSVGIGRGVRANTCSSTDRAPTRSEPKCVSGQPGGLEKWRGLSASARTGQEAADSSARQALKNQQCAQDHREDLRRTRGGSEKRRSDDGNAGRNVNNAKN